jgi:beta-RFAP synthase
MSVELISPARLHFGLFAQHPELPRRFGGVGLMIRRPHLRLIASATEKPGYTASGPAADRIVAFAEAFAQRALQRGEAPGHLPGVDFRVLAAPRPHSGFGSGTQLGMAVGRVLAHLSGMEHLTSPELARLVGRGRRSGIGVHGSGRGGLLVDGGKPNTAQSEAPGPAPLLLRRAFPRDWPLVLVCPEDHDGGLSGDSETSAFEQLPPMPLTLTERMCRLTLMQLLPALAERDVGAFGEALYELQQAAGRSFQGPQGGVYASPRCGRIVRYIRDWGVPGVGQSSWGPTLYAVTEGIDQARALAADLRRRFDLGPDEAWISRADNRGTRLRGLPTDQLGQTPSGAARSAPTSSRE